MPNYASVTDDLIPRFRPLVGDETAKAELLVTDASFWLGVWVPGLAAAVAGGDPDATTAAKLIVVSMVKRALRDERTDGASSETRVASIYTETVTYKNPDGNLYLYASELHDLEVILGRGQSAVSMTSPGL